MQQNLKFNSLIKQLQAQSAPSVAQLQALLQLDLPLAAAHHSSITTLNSNQKHTQRYTTHKPRTCLTYANSLHPIHRNATSPFSTSAQPTSSNASTRLPCSGAVHGPCYSAVHARCTSTAHQINSTPELRKCLCTTNQQYSTTARQPHPAVSTYQARAKPATHATLKPPSQAHYTSKAYTVNLSHANDDSQRRFSTNTHTHTPSRPPPPKRFYKHAKAARCAASPGNWCVELGGKVLKTPAKTPLSVPSRALAMALAAEWEARTSAKGQAFTLPLTQLVAHVVDDVSPRSDMIKTLVDHVHTDTLLVRTDAGTELGARQKEMCEPVLSWAADRIGTQFVPSTGSVLVPPQSDSAIMTLRDYVSNLDTWQLTSAQFLGGAVKSTLLALALVDGAVTVQEGLVLCRLEEDYQSEEWGMVEGGHDLDVADLKVRVAAPVVMLQLLQLG